jgi:Fe2+ transport system protein FeoA
LLSFIFAHLKAFAKFVTGRKHKPKRKALDKHPAAADTETMLQLSGNSGLPETPLGTLVDLRKGDAAVVHTIDLPTDDARRLMEMGFLPGTRVVAGNSAPGGDPRVFQVDGSEIALRRETAKMLKVRFEPVKPPRPV